MKKIDDLDFTRVVGMLSVMMIHVTSTYIYLNSTYTFLSMNLAYLLNQFTRFAVPLFIVLSGITLGLRTARESAATFYKTRFFKIGVPYVIWFTLYYLNEHPISLRPIFSGGLARILPFFRSLLLGQAGPHLYFIILIFQFYLLYPFLIKAVHKAPWKTLLFTFILTYTIQKLFAFLRSNLVLIPDAIRPYLWLLFPTWMFYFVLGMTLSGNRLLLLKHFAAKHAWFVLASTLVCSTLYIIESKLTGLDAIKPSLLLYTVLVLLSCFSLWHIIGKHSMIQTVTRFLARHSMTIFFCHVFVLIYFRQFPFFLRGMSGMLLLYLVVLVSSLVCAVIIDSIILFLKQAWKTPQKSSIPSSSSLKSQQMKKTSSLS